MDKRSMIILIIVIISVASVMTYSYFNQPTQEERWLEVTRSQERLDNLIDKMVENNLERTQQVKLLQTLEAD